jgi:hypothetical protein
MGLDSIIAPKLRYNKEFMHLECISRYKNNSDISKKVYLCRKFEEKRMKKGFLVLFATFLPLLLMSQESQTAYNFLRLPVSAHGAALGGDNITLIEDDASLIFSNPALLSSVSERAVGLNFMNYMSGVNTASATFNTIIGDSLCIGASAQYMGYGTMKEMNADNVQTGEFSANDISLGAYLSYNLSSHLVGGIAAKWITSYIGHYNSIAMCVDLGVNYYSPDHGLSLSLVARNLGGQLKAYDEEYEKLPFEMQAGISKQLAGAPIRLSVTFLDLTHWDYKPINHFAVGAEVFLSDQICVGGGLNFRRANDLKIKAGEESSSHGAGLSLGAGVNLERFKLNLSYGKYHVSSSSIIANISFNI